MSTDKKKNINGLKSPWNFDNTSGKKAQSTNKSLGLDFKTLVGRKAVKEDFYTRVARLEAL